MKAFATFVKYVVVPCSTVVGLFFGFDTYVIGRAGTVVEPVKQKVDVMYDHQKSHEERVERELLMIRSQNDDLRTLIIKYGN